MDKSIFKPEIPIFFRECESNPKSQYLIIAFTCLAASGNTFEFYRVLKIYDKTHQLFISPLKDKYLYGDISENWTSEKILNLIHEIIETYNIKKIITLGGSTAGAGAIIWGYKCAEFIKTSIVVGAPIISTENRLPNKSLMKDMPGIEPYNLTEDICSKKNPPYKDNFVIYIDEDNDIDVENCTPLYKYMKHVNVRGAGHNTMKELFLSGKLYDILDNELNINSKLSSNMYDEKSWYVRDIKFAKRSKK